MEVEPLKIFAFEEIKVSDVIPQIGKKKFKAVRKTFFTKVLTLDLRSVFAMRSLSRPPTVKLLSTLTLLAS